MMLRLYTLHLLHLLSECPLDKLYNKSLYFINYFDNSI